MPTPVPTKPLGVVYRDKNGNEFAIDKLSDGDLMVALHDMLHRKAKHNHKMNKMFAVGETLGNVVRAIHSEAAKRNSQIEPYYQMQCDADQGTLRFTETGFDITIEEDE